MAEKQHIQRFAPQDARTSKVRMRSIVTRDPWLRVIWREIIDCQWEQMKGLPRDPRHLSDLLGVPPEELVRCLQILGPDDLGFLTSNDGPVENSRVAGELAEARAYAHDQALKGTYGARKRWEAERRKKMAPAIKSDAPPMADPSEVVAKAKGSMATATKNDSLPLPYPLPLPMKELLSTEALVAAGPNELLKVWNENRGALAAASAMKGKRAAAAKARLSEEPDLSVHAAAISRLAASSFANGTKNPNGWRADLDFYLKPGSLMKIVEGKYDDRKGGGRPGAPNLGQRPRRDDPAFAHMPETFWTHGGDDDEPAS